MRAPRGDIAVAAFFVLAGQLEVWVWWTPAEQGPVGTAAVLMAAMTVPLGWRRSRPLATMLALAAVLVVWSLADPPRGSLTPWFATIVAAYSVAAYADLRRAVAGLAAIWIAWIWDVARTTNSMADYSFILGFVTAGWVAGVIVRARQQQVAQATDRAQLAEERARTAAADERSRIARELHDVVSHSVSVMVVQANAAEAILDTQPDRVREPLLQIQETGREALVELKRLLGLLRDADDELALAPVPSLAHLDTLLAQVRQAGLPVSLEITGDRRPLPPGVDLSAYRIIQEALTNALKHAGPTSARVAVDYGESAVDVEVVDDGRGESGREALPGGHGLAGMRERVSVHGGDLTAGPRRDGGYVLHATLPL